MNRWNPHQLKGESGEELEHVSSFTNFTLSLQKKILKRFEKLENSISIIIQGPLNNRSINTIDSYLKYGEVIVSCWDKDDVSKLDKYKDKIKIVVNKYSEVPNFHKKPGAQAPWVYQHYTTLNGLKQAKGYFCIKLRSDESFPFLDPIIKNLKYNSHENKNSETQKYQWFKIITSNIYFRFSRENKFHPSDHIVAGEKSRMIEIFNKAIYLCSLKNVSRFPEQLLCKAIIETYWDPIKKKYDKMEDDKCYELMKKHFDIIRIRHLPNHIWTSSYRKYSSLYSEEDWCHHIEKINT
jgi:hypothetical protein